MELNQDNTEKCEFFIIKATNVPRAFFENREEAKRYFRRFGKVKLVSFKPKRNTILIEYTNAESMLKGLELAGEYNGHVFKVTRCTNSIIKKKKVKKDPDPDWTEDPEVRAELEAMGGNILKKTYDLRSEAMNVDPPEPNRKVKPRRWKGVTGTSSPKPQKKKASAIKDNLSSSSEDNDLKQIIKQQAFTVEDKFRILDARDKLIRLNLKKNIEISKAKATVGTCPDMCPEKERLMRETQHQVALYEQEEGGRGMNQKLAIKQYSRSSADQEAPLPQELRPVSVLQMTMGYLMHRIMNLCDSPDVNIAEWYHFLWDRTRGIRKDITQQELCCQGSVELVEQCARFHIFCSARLIAEDPSVFDQKINTENLTKCLQTLKYMYHDLQLKGESCQNEPEFRAYIILLNLNDGNFMWEVQHLKHEIQASKQVKFALEVYSSLDKHNYVKFFKLVNSTTFLNACILMRYFIQVRISAIRTLLKSYSPRVSKTSLPVLYLTKILGFENPESTVDFFEMYGFYTIQDRSQIVLDKSSFSPPEYPYILDRAVHLVESKRQLSIGEVICGRELPPKLYETHIPQNSFDSEGFLKSELDLDEIDGPLTKKEEESTTFTSPVIFQSPTVSFPPKQDESSLRVFGVSSNEEKIPLATVTESKPLWAQQPLVFRPIAQIPQTTQPPEAPKINLEEIEKAKRKQQEMELRKLLEERLKKEQERQEAERRKREETRRKYLEEQEKLKRLEEEKLAVIRRKLIEEQEKRKELERRQNNEIKLAVTSVINNLLQNVEENIKQDKLLEISKKIHERKLKRVVSKWRENCRRRRKRKALDFNPVWLAPRTLQEEAEELRISNQNLTTQNIKRYKRGKPFEIPISYEDDSNKIDLCELTYKLLRKKFLEVEMKLQMELFWKVTISVPNESEFGSGLNHVEKVLDKYVKWERRGGATVLIEQSKNSPTLTYCLEKQKGFVVSSRNETNGFIFIANDFNESLSKRIVHNFQNYGVFVKIPIVLVLQSYTDQKSDLKQLISEGIISDYLILVDKFTSKNLINLIEDALIFLSTKVEKAPPLELDTLKSFLVKYLCNNIWKRANSFAKWNSNYKVCLKNPNTVIYLYNEALERLKEIILNETSQEYAKFPEIFQEFLRSQIPDSLPCDYKYFPNFWNHSFYLKHLERVLNELKFPKLLDNWPPDSQADLETAISKYCSLILKEPQHAFYKTMSILLRDSKGFRNVMWTEVMELLALEAINQTDFSLYGTGFVNKSVFNQLIVVYEVGSLQEFNRSDWFYVNHPIIKQKIYELLNQPVVPEHKEVDDELDLDEILAKIQKPASLDVKKIRNDLSDCTKLLTDLQDSVEINKRILEKSGHLLKTILDEH